MRTLAAAPRSPWCVLTFFLSHAFFLPGAAKQHQPHPPTDAELRERASRLCLTDKRQQQQQQRNEPGGPVASCSFLQHVFCGASFKIASDQWGCRATERKRGQPISEGRRGGAKVKNRQCGNSLLSGNYTKLNPGCFLLVERPENNNIYKFLKKNTCLEVVLKKIPIKSLRRAFFIHIQSFFVCDWNSLYAFMFYDWVFSTLRFSNVKCATNKMNYCCY